MYEQVLVDRRKVKVNGYKSFFENSVFGLFRSSVEGKFILVNQSMADLWGYNSPEEMIASVENIGTQHYLFPENREEYQKIMERDGKTTSFDFQGIKKDGSVFWCRVSAGVVFDDEGNVKYYEGSNIDVTESKESSRKIQEKERKYRELYHRTRAICDAVPELIWSKDLEGKFTFVNKAMCDKLLIASDTDEPIGKTDLYFADRERKSHSDIKDWHTFGEICVDSDKIVLQNNKMGNFDEFGNVRGEFLFLDVDKAPLILCGETVGTVGCGRDVTKLKQQEKLLVEREKLYRRLADNMKDMILEINKEGVIKYASPSYLKHGYTQEELTGKMCFTNVFEDDIPLVMEVFEGVKNNPLQEPDIPEYRFKEKNGNVLWIKSYGIPLFNEEGEFDGGIIVSQDVTNNMNERHKRIEAEKKLQDIYEEAKIRMELLDNKAEESMLKFNNSILKSIQTMRERRLERG